jgi:hypothetical protein
LNRRVRPNHPLRVIRAIIDFGFVRQEVAHCHGYNGNVSTDPEVIFKLMLPLFLDNVKKENGSYILPSWQYVPLHFSLRQ